MTLAKPSPLSEQLLVTCGNCSLAELCIPRGLPQEAIDQIGQLVRRKRTLKRGEYLYRSGDRFRGIIAIKAGTAKLLSLDPAGEEHVVGLLLPGELLGFDAVATDRHACSAVALETLAYCELPAGQLDDICRRVPSLLRELFRHSVAQLDQAHQRAILTKQTSEERVAAFLVDLSDRLTARGFSPSSFRLTLSREEIGNYLGLSLETVSRTLHGLQSRSLIEIDQKQVLIKSLAGLRACAA